MYLKIIAMRFDAMKNVWALHLELPSNNEGYCSRTLHIPKNFDNK